MDVSLSCSLNRVCPAVVQILYCLCNVRFLFNLTSNPCTDCNNMVVNVQMMCNQSDSSAKGLGQQYYDGVSVGWGPDGGSEKQEGVCKYECIGLFCKCYSVQYSLISWQSLLSVSKGYLACCIRNRVASSNDNHHFVTVFIVTTFITL